MKGALAIDEIEAAVVRSIFRDYAAGLSPIKIASRLNDEGIASPSVGSKRKSSGHWKQNTINGNRERGTGILNNELYIGRRIWNRLTYAKDHMTREAALDAQPRERVADRRGAGAADRRPGALGRGEGAAGVADEAPDEGRDHRPQSPLVRARRSGGASICCPGCCIAASAAAG